MRAEDSSPYADLEARLRFETLLVDLSARFINLSPGEVDREIESALRRVCGFLGIDTAVVWQQTASDPGVLVAIHAYPAQENSAGTPAFQEHYPWAAQQTLAGRTIALASLDDAPPEAAADMESARLAGIKSILCLPLSAGGASVGALALHAVQAERDWPEVLVERLHLLAEVIASALARKRADEALSESEARRSLAIDSAEVGVWGFDYRTGTVWASERLRKIFGYSPVEPLTLESFEASILPDHWDRVRTAIDGVVRSGERAGVEYRIVRQGDGEVRWIDSRLTSTGEPHHLVGVSIDITERRRGEEALRVSQVRLAQGVDLAGLGFYEVDLARQSFYADERFRALVGLPPDREEGLQPLEFWMAHLHPDDRQHVMEVRQQLHEGKLELPALEYRFCHPTRGTIWLLHTSRVTASDAAGRATKTVGVIRDVTTRKQAEVSLRQSCAEIEKLKDRLQAESDYLKAEIRGTRAHGEVTGTSAAIQKVLQLVEQVAPTDSSVLVRGETGTGKELVAQAIHRLSPRGNRLMVKVNCAALPSGLVESELFGREKGAFTGALTRQMGRFEVADGSTLFLDEIGELALDLQTKLLRVLESGEFERLGSSRTIKVNVRLVAATNRDLSEAIKQGRFREDLYYRLNVFPIRVPPLRDRREDIPLLVWTFLDEFCFRMGKKITQIPRQAMEAIQRHSWPGNVRELRNVIEHAAILTSGDTLRVPAFDDATQAAASPQTLADAEREHILRALERAGWHVKGPTRRGRPAGDPPGNPVRPHEETRHPDAPSPCERLVGPSASSG